MKFRVKSLSCLIVIAIFAVVVNAEVAPVRLEELTRDSDLILIGKVTSVKQVGDEKFTQVEVLKTLKGNSQKAIFLSVTKTWTCDVSNAVEGETALFFLYKYLIRPASE